MSSSASGGTQSLSLANRFVLLGASNLTMSLRLVIELLQHRIGGPSDVLVAAGHGRSYGNFSQVMFRELPGITSSGLWKQLEQSSDRPTYALLTDIGNDIPYGFSPRQILAWVSWCVSRLQDLSAHIIVTNVPIASIEAMPDWRYNVLRPILFPYCQLSKNNIVERARMVHDGLVGMASSMNFTLYDSAKEWFGFDAIHVRYRQRTFYYQRVLEHLPEPERFQRPSVNHWLRFLRWKQRPSFAHKRVFGMERCRQQPSGQLYNGSHISLY